VSSATNTIGGTVDAAITPTTISLSPRRRMWTAARLRRILRSFAAYAQSGGSHPLWTSGSPAAQFSLLPAREQDRLLDRGCRISGMGG
jgi:hypothetical protein